ncbi:MAG: hypothetical protein ACTSQ7_16015 [Alphaproteobacteria bacterium]
MSENRSHQAAAIAVEKAEVLEVSHEEFMKKLNVSDPVMKTVVNHLVSRLREMTREFGARGDGVVTLATTLLGEPSHPPGGHGHQWTPPVFHIGSARPMPLSLARS